jgi:hypothetical protein
MMGTSTPYFERLHTFTPSHAMAMGYGCCATDCGLSEDEDEDVVTKDPCSFINSCCVRLSVRTLDGQLPFAQSSFFLLHASYTMPLNLSRSCSVLLSPYPPGPSRVTSTSTNSCTQRQLCANGPRCGVSRRARAVRHRHWRPVSIFASSNILNRAASRFISNLQ